MNKTVNDYISNNWSSIKNDLALSGKHTGTIDVKQSVGEGYINPNQGGNGVRSSTYMQTSYVRVTIKLISDNPAEFGVITTFPSTTIK